MSEKRNSGVSPMARALQLAAAAGAAGEVPVGAVIVDAAGRLRAETANRMRASGDPTAHAEMLAIREAAAALGEARLVECDLYVTLEPCAMCAAAIAFARIRRLYFGASDPKGGAVEHGPRFFAQATCHHRPEIYGGIGEREAGALLSGFFAARRAESSEAQFGKSPTPSPYNEQQESIVIAKGEDNARR
jgi:tRNA(adenine34) deaminase